jgi:hypothetical protein
LVFQAVSFLPTYQHSLCTFLPPIRTTCPTQLMLLSPLPCWSLWRPNIFLSTLFSNTISGCSSLNVTGHVSHPCKTRSKSTQASGTKRAKAGPVWMWYSAEVNQHATCTYALTHRVSCGVNDRQQAVSYTTMLSGSVSATLARSGSQADCLMSGCLNPSATDLLSTLLKPSGYYMYRQV